MFRAPDFAFCIVGPARNAHPDAVRDARHGPSCAAALTFELPPADPGAQPDAFFTGAARALLYGLPPAGVGRLLVVGLASVLPNASGAALMDTSGYPQEYRSFYLAHAAGAEMLRAAPSGLDWLIVSPAGDFDRGGVRTGSYRVAAADAASRISYLDFATALLDEIDTPKHHGTHLGVEAS